MLLAVACASGPRPYLAADAPLHGRPRVAVVPFEDLSGDPGMGDKVSHIFFAELARTGLCEVVEPGNVMAAVRELQLRNTGSLTTDQIRTLGGKLEARYLMLGTVLESGRLQTASGAVPTLGVTVRLLDATDGRVEWADVRIRTGDDRETVFGWGRERSPEKLAESIAAEMLRTLDRLAGPPAATQTGGQP